MSKILNTENFKEQLAQIGAMDWDASVSRGLPVLQQTKKNACKRELLLGLRSHLEEYLADVANVYYTSEGIAIEIENDAVRAKVPEGNGFITMIVDLKFKDLSYDAMTEADLFEEENARKLAAKAQRDEEKAQKASARANKTSSKV